jgi:hypothetical protein
MQRLEVSGAVRLIYGSLGAKGLMNILINNTNKYSSVQIHTFMYSPLNFRIRAP